MALDGIVISNLIYDLNRTISGVPYQQDRTAGNGRVDAYLQGELRAGTFKYFCKRVSSTDVSGIKK